MKTDKQPWRRGGVRRVSAAVLAALSLSPSVLAAEAAVDPPRAEEETLYAAEAAVDSLRAEEETVYAGEVPALDSWQLRLVSPTHKLPEDFQVELVTLSGGRQVDARIRDDLEAMLADCRKAGLSPYICSAYRTHADQQRLFSNKVSRLRRQGYGAEAAETEAARWVAAPDTSEHQLGLALDITAGSYVVLNKSQENTAEQKWLMVHCWEYGFVLRFPEDRTEITGIGYEPWHYRYVGRAAAAALRESGQCLEEYLADRAGEEAAAEALAAATPVDLAAGGKAAGSAGA